MTQTKLNGDHPGLEADLYAGIKHILSCKLPRVVQCRIPALQCGLGLLFLPVLLYFLMSALCYLLCYFVRRDALREGKGHFSNV